MKYFKKVPEISGPKIIEKCLKNTSKPTPSDTFKSLSGQLVFILGVKKYLNEIMLKSEEYQVLAHRA